MADASGIRAGKAFVELVMKSDRLLKQLKAAEKEFQRTFKRIGKMQMALEQKIRASVARIKMMHKSLVTNLKNVAARMTAGMTKVTGRMGQNIEKRFRSTTQRVQMMHAGLMARVSQMPRSEYMTSAREKLDKLSKSAVDAKSKLTNAFAPSFMSRVFGGLQQKIQGAATSMQNLGRSFVMFGAMAGLAVAAPVKAFMGFEDQLLTTKAVTGATDAEYQRLYDQAKQLGATTSFTATEIARGQTGLGRSGLNTTEIEQSIPEVANLSRATGVDMGEVADMSTVAMRAFELQASDMNRIVNVLAATANGSTQTLTDLAEGLKPVAAIANNAGESIETTNAALAVLADHGLRGSEAGSQLARAYKNLTMEVNRKEIEKYGVAVQDAAGNFRPMADILADMGNKVRGLGNVERIGAFETIFGRGQVAATTLAKSGGKFDAKIDRINQGVANDEAKKSAEIMDSGIGGGFRMMTSAIGDVAITIGEVLKPTLMDLFKRIQGMSNTISNWVKENKGLIISVVKVAGAILAAGAALFAAGAALKLIGLFIAPLLGVFSLLGTAIAAVGAAFSILFSPIGAIVAIVGVAIATVATLAYWFRNLVTESQWFKDISARFSEALNAIVSAIKKGEIETAWSVVVAALKVEWINFRDWIKSVLDSAWKKIVDNLPEGFSKAMQKMAKMLDALLMKMESLRQKAITGLADAMLVAYGEITGMSDAEIEDMREQNREIGKQKQEDLAGDQEFQTQIQDALNMFLEGPGDTPEGDSPELAAAKDELKRLADLLKSQESGPGGEPEPKPEERAKEITAKGIGSLASSSNGAGDVRNEAIQLRTKESFEAVINAMNGSSADQLLAINTKQYNKQLRQLKEQERTNRLLAASSGPNFAFAGDAG
ncbi:MAG: phage tail tape measure protein [Planctomyces sp.]|nr:phage tail tape measure protein [Planctomyces sp.]